MDAGIAAIVGVVVGGTIGVAGQFIFVRYQENLEAKGVALALRAEISAIKENAERREYHRHFESFLNEWKNGRMHDVVPNIEGISTEIEPIAGANLTRIGKLKPEDAADVVLFYTRLVQINGNIVGLGSGAWPSIEDKIRLVESELELSRTNFQLADQLIDRLNY